MLKLSDIVKAILVIVVAYTAYFYFSTQERIDGVNGWLQLIISGGLLTPLATYAWTLKGRFEKLIEDDGLTSIELTRLSNSISIFIKKIWLWMFFYIFSAAIIALSNIVKSEPAASRYLGTLSISLIFIALLSAISLRNFDVSLANLKAAIIIRKKRNREREYMLKILNADDKFSEEEKKHFKNINSED
jgi:glucan phosphoethanolaminetransferase (alkaline phosphatase superfamily)